MGEMARFLGADSSSIEAIDLAIREKHSGWVRAKEAIVPRTEKWEIRFLRGPGCWLTTARRLDPDPTNVLPGIRIPRYVRLVVPVDKDGRMPMSLAPRAEDLPRVAEGRWRNTGKTRGYKAPTLTINIPAPRYGIIFYAVGQDANPVIVRFPANKGLVGPAIRKLAQGATDYHAGLVKARWDKEKRERKETYTAACGTD
jgi:hypothetical protein